jgi:hypothetical protein
MRPGAMLVAEGADLRSTHACELSNSTAVFVIQKFPKLAKLVSACRSALTL